MMDVSLVLLPGSRGKPKPFIHRHLLSYETHTLTHTFFFPLLSSISIYTTALEPVTERHIQTFKTLSPFEVSRVILPRNFTRFSVWFMLCCFLSIPLLFIKPRWGCKCMKPAVRARVCVCVCACFCDCVKISSHSSHIGLWGWWLSGASLCAGRWAGKLGLIFLSGNALLCSLCVGFPLNFHS